MHALGVDLGTSNTVAVVRWPDGRTRPLLFDGEPIMPSGVYADQTGRLHVGRDARRLAQADPGRYEPNPKRRVDEAAVLLGDREVPTVDLLAAILTEVGEAAGGVPAAALSYPASWGARRRDVLVAALTRAGWPAETVLVPEPVAAARYFAEVLGRPVPIGSALAVFDFGGGTLDIAVVRNSGAGRFGVLGSGGLADLGGLDLDAALVSHLGELLQRSAPEVWQRLSQPQTASQWRDRRQFWEEVRGAKEMLSRAASAPVSIPNVDSAVHLTREELEQAITPLLRRGVYEAASVIAGCQLKPEQLAGVFLVGGSSRVPLVARMLHAELGIAPTVLEQPELPVAEGALAEVLAPVVKPPPEAEPPPAEQPAPKRRRVPNGWAVAGAAAALAGLAALLVVLLNGPDELDFRPFDEVTRVSMNGAEPLYSYTGLAGDRAYLAWEQDKRLHIVAVDSRSGAEKWRHPAPSTSDGWAGITALPYGVVAWEEKISSTADRTMYVLGAADGSTLWSRTIVGDDRVYFFDNVTVLADSRANRLVGLDPRTGETKWDEANPTDEYGNTGATVMAVTTDKDLRGGAFTDRPVFVGDHRLVQIGADRTARVFDAETGKVLASRGNVGEPTDLYLAHQDTLVVAADKAGYQVQAYDLAGLGEPRNIYTADDDERRLSKLVPCGPSRVCLLDMISSDVKTAQVAAVDLESARQRWRRDVPGTQVVVPVGDQVLAVQSSPNVASSLFDVDGERVMGSRRYAVPVDDRDLLLFTEYPSSVAADLSVAGMGAESLTLTELGQLEDVRGESCSWNSSVMICPADGEFGIWRFTH